MKKFCFGDEITSAVKRWGLCVSSIALAYGVMFACGITCPIRFLTGISCPGCGMTRAVFSALRLRFLDAFRFHPLWVLLLPAVASIGYLSLKKKKNARRTVMILCAALLLVIYIIRMAMGSEIVTFDLSQGAIVRLIRWILSVFQKTFKEFLSS